MIVRYYCSMCGKQFSSQEECVKHEEHCTYALIPGIRWIGSLEAWEPCDDCREHKVVMFEAAEEGGHTPTGRYVVLDKKEWLSILKEPEKAKDCFRVVVSPQAFNELFCSE